MARYYFHVRDGEQFEEDPEGAEFQTVDNAIREAFLAARELIAAKVLAGEVIGGQVFEIADDTGQVIEKVAFRSALRLDK